MSQDVPYTLIGSREIVRRLHFLPEHTYCWPLPGGITVEVRFTGPAGPDHFEMCRQYLQLAIGAVSLPSDTSGSAGGSWGQRGGS